MHFRTYVPPDFTGGSWARSGLPASVLAINYDQANEQLAFGEVAQTFDANGNLLTQTDAAGTTTYTWDARNRLVAVSGPTVSASFTYDALGRRIGKTINGHSTSFLYDGLDIVRESGPSGDAAYLRTLAIDEALTRTDASGTFTYLADILGSTVALADATGSLPTTYTYAPFGETAFSGLSSPSPFQFTGRENDGGDLYYARSRHYSPVLHRFLTQDRLGLLGGVNFYRYVLNNPLSFVDPLGLDVTVTLYRGAGPFGHIGIGLDAPSTVGHYPSERSLWVPLLQDVPGQIVNEPLHKTGRDVIDTIRIPTTANQDRAMERVINEAMKGSRYYNLYFRNCATFVEEVLRAGGVDAPETHRPRELFRQLQLRYGEPPVTIFEGFPGLPQFAP